MKANDNKLIKEGGSDAANGSTAQMPKKSYESKKKALAKMSKSEMALSKETPEQQKLNRQGRRGIKRPESGPWPMFKRK